MENSAGILSGFHCCILSSQKNADIGADPQSNKRISKQEGQEGQEEASLWRELWNSIATAAEGRELSIEANFEKMHAADSIRLEYYTT